MEDKRLRKYKHFIGEKIHHYVVIDLIYDHGAKLVCKCHCGAVFKIPPYEAHKNLGCGECPKHWLLGERFGRLTVTSLKGKGENGKGWFWECICDCGNIHCVSGGNLVAGNVNSCGCLYSGVNKNKRSLVCGVGVNDADYVVYSDTFCCPYYRKWTHMLKRCYSDNALSKKSGRSYRECTVDKSWHRFTPFRDWCIEQENLYGYNIGDLCLDKDILVPHNKIYSPETCCFVPNDINIFVSGENRGGTSVFVGVWVNKDGDYVSQCNNPFTGSRMNLGIFSSERDAHIAWARKKLFFAKQFTWHYDKRIVPAMVKRYENCIKSTDDQKENN